MCRDYETCFQLTLPDVTLADQLTLMLSDMTIDIYFVGKGFHSGSDLFISIPEEGLVFTGDVLSDYPTYPNLHSGAELLRMESVVNSIKADNPLKHVITIHAGTLSRGDFDRFHEAVKKLNSDKQTKTSLIHFLKDRPQTTSMSDALKTFHVSRSNYYYSEGDIINFALEMIEDRNEKEAQAFLLFSEALIPNSVEFKIMLAELYEGMGSHKKAREYYREAMKLNPMCSYCYERLYFLSKDTK
jgi:tetratricopeptide (TPR) repeat protein